MLEELYLLALSAAVVAQRTGTDLVLLRVRDTQCSGSDPPEGPQWLPFPAQLTELSVQEDGLVLKYKQIDKKAAKANVIFTAKTPHMIVEN